jgi:hypothetical protein
VGGAVAEGAAGFAPATAGGAAEGAAAEAAVVVVVVLVVGLVVEEFLGAACAAKPRRRCGAVTGRLGTADQHTVGGRAPLCPLTP